MDFTLTCKEPPHEKLLPEDLKFFYYDIAYETQLGEPRFYDWKKVLSEFSGLIEVECCDQNKISNQLTVNKIQYTISNDDSGESEAFFRHLRNAFAHFSIFRDGEFLIIQDSNGKTFTMNGKVDAKLLSKFCNRLLQLHNELLDNFIQNQPPKV